MTPPDPHPECGGATVACTCHWPAAQKQGEAAPLLHAFPPEHVAETSADVAALIPKEVG